MENLEALDGRFVLLWDSSMAVRIHDSASQDSNLGPISLAPEHLTDRPQLNHPYTFILSMDIWIVQNIKYNL